MGVPHLVAELNQNSSSTEVHVVIVDRMAKLSLQSSKCFELPVDSFMPRSQCRHGSLVLAVSSIVWCLVGFSGRNSAEFRIPVPDCAGRFRIPGKEGFRFRHLFREGIPGGRNHVESVLQAIPPP